MHISQNSRKPCLTSYNFDPVEKNEKISFSLSIRGHIISMFLSLSLWKICLTSFQMWLQMQFVKFYWCLKVQIDWYPCLGCHNFESTIDETKLIVPPYSTLKILYVCQFSSLDESICTHSQVYSICKNHSSANVPSSTNLNTPLWPLSKCALLFIMSPNNIFIVSSWQWTNALVFVPPKCQFDLFSKPKLNTCHGFLTCLFIGSFNWATLTVNIFLT